MHIVLVWRHGRNNSNETTKIKRSRTRTIVPLMLRFRFQSTTIIVLLLVMLLPQTSSLQCNPPNHPYHRCHFHKRQHQCQSRGVSSWSHQNNHESKKLTKRTTTVMRHSKSPNSAEEGNSNRKPQASSPSTPYRLGLGGFRFQTEHIDHPSRQHNNPHTMRSTVNQTYTTSNSSTTGTSTPVAAREEHNNTTILKNDIYTTTTTTANGTHNNISGTPSNATTLQSDSTTNNVTTHTNSTTTPTTTLPFTALLKKQQLNYDDLRNEYGVVDESVKKIIDDLMNAVSNVTNVSKRTSFPIITTATTPSFTSSRPSNNNKNSNTTKNKKPYEFKSPFLSMTQFNASAFRSMTTTNTDDPSLSSKSSPLSLLKNLDDNDDNMDEMKQNMDGSSTSDNDNNNNDDNNDKSHKKKSSNNFMPNNKKGITSRTTVVPLATLGRRKEDILTVADLEKILLGNGFVRKADLSSRSTMNDYGDNEDSEGILSNSNNNNSGGTGSMSSSLPLSKSTNTGDTHKKNAKNDNGNNKQVAFPQSSTLSYQGVTMGSTVSGGMLGILLGLSVYPNLWLLGMVLGCAYGYDSGIKEKQHIQDAANGSVDEEGSGGLRVLIVSLGRRLAKAYLRLYDGCAALWFMYKTGQLSYEYYKTYESLDGRFAIQDKMDAWNERFQEGKIKFDQWEKENEIGRKALATMRTIWLVQEESAATTKKNKKQQKRFKFLSVQQGKSSRYRIVQYFYNVLAWCQQVWFRARNYANGGMHGKDLSEFWKGLKSKIMENSSEQVQSRIGAAVAALVGTFCIGTMFAVAPNVLGLVAVVLGVLFPTWLPEFVERFAQVLNEVKERGRSLKSNGENNVSVAKSNNKLKTRGELSWLSSILPSLNTPSSNSNNKVTKDKIDMNRYHFYQRNDGSKHWYRTGKPWFDFGKKDKIQKKGFFSFRRESDQRKMDSWGFWT